MRRTAPRVCLSRIWLVIVALAASVSFSACRAASPASPPAAPTALAPALTGVATQRPAPSPTSAPSATPTTLRHSALPASCQRAGQGSFVSQGEGYCFSYPLRFTSKPYAPAQPFLFGPALDSSPDPVAAKLSVEVLQVPAGTTLAAAVDMVLSQYRNMPTPAIERKSSELGGAPAELLEVVPGREGSRDVLAVHNSRLYRLVFMPSVRDFPQAQADVEELFAAVTASFAFLP